MIEQEHKAEQTAYDSILAVAELIAKKSTGPDGRITFGTVMDSVIDTLADMLDTDTGYRHLVNILNAHTEIKGFGEIEIGPGMVPHVVVWVDAY